jgi:predicted dehydrogenase
MGREKLRFALVGLGFSRLILKEYVSAPGVELALLCDLNEAKAREQSREFGIPYTLRFEDCLGSGIDAVDVSTPNHLHASQAIAALQAGKHVFLQKPMAPSVADCARIVRAARAAGREIGLFMSGLNSPVNHELRAMVAAGAFGKLISMRGRMAHRNAHVTWKRWNYAADYWRRKKELVGGGGMALIGIHAINLLPWLAGRRIESLSAFSENLASREIMEGDDITAAVCRLEGDGALAVLEASYASEGGGLEICGTAGYAVRHGSGELRLRLDAPWKGRVLEVPGGEGEAVFSHEEIEKRAAPLEAECEQHRAFARAVLAGQPPPVTGEDGLRDVAVLEAIYRSARSGRRERPEIPELSA